ncbi:MAG: hypothetical protein RL129_532 [Actinomycetota bacterium]
MPYTGGPLCWFDEIKFIRIKNWVTNLFILVVE